MERPFSLTPDPKYFFKSRSHGRALESLTFRLRRRDPFLLITGDLSVGKTTICRTLAERLRRRAPVAYVANPLLSSAELLRLMLEDFGAISNRDSRALAADSQLAELYDLFVPFASGLKRARQRRADRRRGASPSRPRWSNRSAACHR